MKKSFPIHLLIRPGNGVCPGNVVRPGHIVRPGNVVRPGHVVRPSPLIGLQEFPTFIVLGGQLIVGKDIHLPLTGGLPFGQRIEEF